MVCVLQVNGYEQHFVFAWNRSHYFFSSVAVMRVEIEDGDSLAAPLKSMHGPNSNAVEYAKSTAYTVLKQPLNAAVMTWRSHNAERVFALTVEHCINC